MTPPLRYRATSNHTDPHPPVLSCLLLQPLGSAVHEVGALLRRGQALVAAGSPMHLTVARTMATCFIVTAMLPC